VLLIREIQKEFGPYRNKYGFVSAGGDFAHNPIFHGFYIALLQRLGLLTEQQKRIQKVLMQKLIHPDYPGILLGAPYGQKNSNKFSHDNHKAMFWISKTLGMSFAQDFLDHGRKHAWNYNPDHPEKFTLYGAYGRNGEMIAQAQIAAGENPGFMMGAWLTVHMYHAAIQRRKHIEPMTLPYYIAKTVNGHNGFISLACNYWRSQGLKKYPGGMGEVLDHWGGPWKGHPYVKYYDKVIDI
jgi:hypothetical protein